MTAKKRKSSGVPKAFKIDPAGKRYRAQETQTRKMLGRHYAAKYRVDKGR